MIRAFLNKAQGSASTKSKNAALIHVLLTALLPILLYVLVVLDFTVFALAVVLLSKWRMFAVKLRHWFANIRANAVDMLVGVSAVSFMHSAYATQQRPVLLGVVVLYMAWLLFVKPRSSVAWVGVQALLAQTFSLIALFLQGSGASETLLTFSVWSITYLCARHFLSAFDEAMARASAYTWAFFCAALTWLTAHWLLFYQSVAQPALIITIVSYGMAVLYYLQHTDKLSKGVQRQFIALMVAVVLFVLVFSDWQGVII